MKLLKDYDCTIKYDLGKANAANALSRMVIGFLAYRQTIYYLLLLALRDIGVKLDMDYFRAEFQVQPILINQVGKGQCHDP